MSQKRKSAPERFVVAAEQPRTLRVAIVSFLAGAGVMWLGLHYLGGDKPSSAVAAAAVKGAPDVSQLPPVQAAVTLGNFEYDRANWGAAVLHYQRAIGAGADSADVRTDLGTAYRYLGDASKALEQYNLAQRKDPFHQNSLFNQAIVYTELLRDRPKALAIAREFLRRFPQSQGAEGARRLIADLDADRAAAEKKLTDFITTPSSAGP